MTKGRASGASARGTAVRVSPKDDRPIVVATNFGVGSRAGLEFALETARVRGSDVIALHVVEPPVRTSPLRVFERLHTERRKRAYERMDRWLANVAERARVMVWIEPGNPERVLVDTTIGASCLVLGTCGKIGVASRVAERSLCPIHVVLRPPW